MENMRIAIKITTYSLFLIFLLAGTHVLAATQGQIDQITNTIEKFCLSGSEYQLKASVAGEIQILKIKPGAEGNINVNVKKSGGGVGYIDEQIRLKFDKETRDCMKPYIDNLIKIILGTAVLPSGGSSAPISLATECTTDGTNWKGERGDCNSSTPSCYKAPDGYVVDETSISVRCNSCNPPDHPESGCKIDYQEKVDVGKGIRQATKACLTAHARSPGGMDHVNARGWAKCVADGRAIYIF